jgi:hypothetical protein
MIAMPLDSMVVISPSLMLHHDPMHTERPYGEWIARFFHFHGMLSREDMFPVDPQIESFLTDLAVRTNIAAAAGARGEAVLRPQGDCKPCCSETS